MTLRERWSRLDALQKGRLFKIIASCVVVLAGVLGVVAYVVATHVPAAHASQVLPDAPAGATPEQRSAIESTRRVVEMVLHGRQDPVSVGVWTGAAVLVALGVVWLGLGLTYLGLTLLGLLPALLMGMVLHWNGPAWGLGGVVALTGALTAGLSLARAALGSGTPVLAIARNVLDEATRLKLSLVFIVALVGALALLPLALDADQPLRYRVQTFLSFSMGGSFWIIASLVVVFSVATVAFEQRDRTIWQTATKPVSAFQYVLGKWLGLSVLAAILLGVTGAGVFLYTEYLRSQPAAGEAVRPGSDQVVGISKDRLILESQVLTARVVRQPAPVRLDEAQFQKNVDAKVQAELQQGARDFARLDPAEAEAERRRIADKLAGDLRKSVDIEARSIPPARGKVYTFEGLGAARGSDKPILLRYKIEAGGNAPTATYKIGFQFPNTDVDVQDVALGQFQVLTLRPDVIPENGTVEVLVINGDPGRGLANPLTMSFPPDGLEISYSAASFAGNFVRVLIVLWIKLSFLAILAVAAGTFLSFPVASLVAFGSFLAAEATPFLKGALDSYSTEDQAGKTILFKALIARVAQGVASVFDTYASLAPTRRVVEGTLMSWGDMGLGLAILAVWSGVLYLLGAAVFRKRELATYSGH